jgi:hypothetical protein
MDGLFMKQIFLILAAAAGLLLAGCNQGGTSDQYNTSHGGTNGMTTNTHP